MIDIKVKFIDTNAKIPTYSTENSACFDIYAIEDLIIFPYKSYKVRTGLCIEPPEGWYIDIRPRSGLSFDGYCLDNAPGTADTDFRGEYCILLSSKFGDIKYITKGQRIAQGKPEQYTKANFIIVDKLSDTKRGEGGFGSTGRF